jgi:hypothetical protein
MEMESVSGSWKKLILVLFLKLTPSFNLILTTQDTNQWSNISQMLNPSSSHFFSKILVQVMLSHKEPNLKFSSYREKN